MGNAGFLEFSLKIPGEIRGQEMIFRRPDKLGLWENPFVAAEPPQMI